MVAPNFIKHNPPENPNVVKSWRNSFNELPECPIISLHFKAVKEFLKGFGKGFQEPFAKGLANQEQEQEQEQEEACAELPAVPPIVILPCTGKGASLVSISPEKAQEWQRDFPGVDVPQALRSMRAWLMANPTKRKTARGIPAFVVRWLTKEQDNPKGQARAAPRERRSFSPTPNMDQAYEMQILAAFPEFPEGCNA